MATICLYANKINGMPDFVNNAKKSVGNLKDELITLKNKCQAIDANYCNVDDIINDISTSTKTQEEKIESLEKLNDNIEQFVIDTERIDNEVADIIEARKNDFYDEYTYLKPDCEKSVWEKAKSAFKAVGEWCKEHWKLIATIVIVIAAIVVIVCTAGAALGPFMTIAVVAAKGAIVGAITGGLIGGITSSLMGGSFLDGFEDGALSGAIGGAIFGGLGGAGQLVGKSVSCLSKLGGLVKGVSKVTGVLSIGMGLFDSLALLDLMIDKENNWLYDINSNLHSNSLYNAFQISVSALAVFTGGMSSTMTCFVAGTMVLTTAGLVAIEYIKAGDKVISTNSDTFEVAEKTVLQTFIRESTQLIHLIINGEEIITTQTHPFYVNGIGFVDAGDLKIGDELLDTQQNVLIVEDTYFEICDEPVTVYNFEVEDFHTYHVGQQSIWVHNANCRRIDNGDGTYDLELGQKDDWTPSQRKEAELKCEALTNADTIKTNVSGKRNATKTSRFRKDNDIPSTQDADHTIDLQLGGADDFMNLAGLDKSVNRSLGKQINILTNDLSEGTILRNFIMK